MAFPTRWRVLLVLLPLYGAGLEVLQRWVPNRIFAFLAVVASGPLALVLQRRPAFTVAQVRSAIINTANGALFDGADPASFAKYHGELTEIMA